MRREPLKYLLAIALIVVGSIELTLLLSGKRVLIDEQYLPEHPGIIGSAVYAEDARYECKYFTGRKQVIETLSVDQYDECPFIWSEG